MGTWYDIKLATLQKMFSADDMVIEDESTLGYLSAMPYAANEGLALLATAGKFITKSIRIAQGNHKNLLDNSASMPITQFTNEMVFAADGGNSFYFECSGKGACQVIDGENVVLTIAIDSSGYSEYKGTLEEPSINKLSLRFNTEFPMSVKNVAIYENIFETDAKVVPFTSKIRYDLKELAPDFYMIDPQGIYFDGAYQTYLQTSDFYQEGTHTLVLDRDMHGNFTIYYRAYPEQITAETADDYELPIDNEIFALLPLYIASQLYKDDDNGIATSYRNEFEVGFERLRNSANLSAYEEFTSESGWI